MEPHPLAALFGDDFQQATRQCVSCNLCRGFCSVFPALYELLADDRQSGLVSPTEAYRAVVDLCWLCGRCELRCPGNLQFAQRLTRAKAQLAAQQGLSVADRVLSHPQAVGQWGTSLAPLSNRLPMLGIVRAVLERVVGLDHRASWPAFAHTPFRRQVAQRVWSGERGAESVERKTTQHAARTSEHETQNPRRRVAYFVGCHTDFYDPTVGEAAVAVLAQNDVDVIVPPYRCCGMPQLAVGDEAGATENARVNIANWSRLVADGYDVVTTCSTCALMLRQTYADLWPSEESRLLAAHSHDLFSYLAGFADQGLGVGGRGPGSGARAATQYATRSTRPETRSSKLETQAPPKLNVAYHYPCHARHQRYGYNVVDTLRLIPGLEVEFAPAACCGQGGSHGFRAEAHDRSLEQGAELLEHLTERAPDLVVTDCPMCQHRIASESGLAVCHPVELLGRAYGG